MVWAVVDSMEFLIRRSSRIQRKRDIDTEEIWSDIVSDESKMTKRLRAESDGAMVTFEGMRREETDTLNSCLGRLMRKNSVLDWFSERRFYLPTSKQCRFVVSRWKCFVYVVCRVIRVLLSSAFYRFNRFLARERYLESFIMFVMLLWTFWFHLIAGVMSFERNFILTRFGHFRPSF